MTSESTGPPAKRPVAVYERIAPQVVELHASGHGRNEIARRLGRSETTVSRAARLVGLTFDGAATEDATRARVKQIANLQREATEALAQVSRAAARRLLVEVRAGILDPQAVRALSIASGVSYDKVAAYLSTAPDEAMAEAVDQIAALSDSILTAADAYSDVPELGSSRQVIGGLDVA